MKGLVAQIYRFSPLGQGSGFKCTSKKTAQVLGSIGVLDAINESIILICLHTSLDAVERESGQGGKDAGRAGGYLGPVAFDKGIGMISSASG